MLRSRLHRKETYEYPIPMLIDEIMMSISIKCLSPVSDIIEKLQLNGSKGHQEVRVVQKNTSDHFSAHIPRLMTFNLFTERPSARVEAPALSSQRGR